MGHCKREKYQQGVNAYLTLQIRCSALCSFLENFRAEIQFSEIMKYCTLLVFCRLHREDDFMDKYCNSIFL